MDSQPTHIPLEGIKAAIFDMDGTMVNNMEFHKKAWQAFLEKYHILLSDEDFNKKISGKKNNEIFSIVFGHTVSLEDEAKYTQEKEAMYRELYAEAIAEVPGLKSVLNHLKQKGVKLAIATTATRENREFVLKALNLEGLFDVILGDEDVTQGKPHPEIYLKTAERLGVLPSECIAFEDTLPGVASAKSAGMKVVGILTTHSKEDLAQANYIVNDFQELVLN